MLRQKNFTVFFKKSKQEKDNFLYIERESVFILKINYAALPGQEGEGGLSARIIQREFVRVDRNPKITSLFTKSEFNGRLYTISISSV